MTTPSFGALFRCFGRIGVLSFGGPAAQIGLLHRELVEDRNWLSEQNFADALAFCMVLPGPEAMQLATYCGWKLRGWTGGLLAGALFVAPGALVIATLAILYARFGTQPDVSAALLGIQAAVIVIVLGALRALVKRALKHSPHWICAGLSFLALWLASVPFPLVVGLAALVGAAMHVPKERAPPADMNIEPPWRTVIFWGALWAMPLPVLALLAPPPLFDLAIFFGTLAIVTFGGAYAVLAYMAQQVVDNHAWISAAQMVDALGLAETTPGPLILVTQFVGMLAGFANGGICMALLAGAVTLWMTFVPCFLWIFAGAPYIDHLAQRPRLRAALDMVTAAVVGVIVNLSLWFAIHVVFQSVEPQTVLGNTLLIPVASSLSVIAMVLLIAADVLFFRLKWGPLRLIPALAVLGWILALF